MSATLEVTTSSFQLDVSDDHARRGFSLSVDGKMKPGGIASLDGNLEMKRTGKTAEVHVALNLSDLSLSVSGKTNLEGSEDFVDATLKMNGADIEFDMTSSLPGAKSMKFRGTQRQEGTKVISEGTGSIGELSYTAKVEFENTGETISYKYNYEATGPNDFKLTYSVDMLAVRGERDDYEGTVVAFMNEAKLADLNWKREAAYFEAKGFITPPLRPEEDKRVVEVDYRFGLKRNGPAIAKAYVLLDQADEEGSHRRLLQDVESSVDWSLLTRGDRAAFRLHFEMPGFVSSRLGYGVKGSAKFASPLDFEVSLGGMWRRQEIAYGIKLGKEDGLYKLHLETSALPFSRDKIEVTLTAEQESRELFKADVVVEVMEYYCSSCESYNDDYGYCEYRGKFCRQKHSANFVLSGAGPRSRRLEAKIDIWENDTYLLDILLTAPGPQPAGTIEVLFRIASSGEEIVLRYVIAEVTANVT